MACYSVSIKRTKWSIHDVGPLIIALAGMVGKGHTFTIYYINTYVLPLMMLLKKLNINRQYYNYAHLISRTLLRHIYT